MEQDEVFQKVLDELSSSLTHSSFNRDFFENLLYTLQSLNYTLIVNDCYTLSNLILKIENNVKNYCNVKTINSELFYICNNLICGEFLLIKKQTGQLDINYNLEKDVKSINIGDRFYIFF